MSEKIKTTGEETLRIQVGSNDSVLQANSSVTVNNDKTTTELTLSEDGVNVVTKDHVTLKNNRCPEVVAPNDGICIVFDRCLSFPGSGAVWGGITGELSDQTDLQDALDGKADTAHTHPLSDITQSGAVAGQVPKWNGSAWVPADDNEGVASVSWGDITGTLADQSDLQTALDGKSDVGHTHPPSDIEQAGATTGQVLKWNGTEWAPADDETGGGGGGECCPQTDTYANWNAARLAGTLPTNTMIIVSDRGDTGMQLTTTDNPAEIGVSGVAGFLNADFQAVGDYSGVEAETGIAPGTQLGIWRLSFEAVTILYYDLAGGSFAVGDTITGGTTGATAVILSDDGTGTITAYMTSPGVSFDGTELIDNGAGVSASMDGVPTTPTITTGDIVIWNLLHYQCIDATQINGTDPETNTAAFSLLPKTLSGAGYIEEWDNIEFDFVNDWIQYRADKRGNKLQYTYAIEQIIGLGYNAISAYQWGNDIWYSNVVNNGYIDGINLLCEIASCQLESEANITNITAISGNTISSCRMSPGSVITNITMDIGAAIYNSVFDFTARFDGLILRESAEIFNIKMGVGAEFSQKTINSGISVSNFTNSITINTSEQIFSNIENKRCEIGFSNVEKTIDITGLTYLDCLPESNYVGVFNITSTNATETVDSITNFPTAFPFIIRPAAGLTLTITGTAISGIAAGQFALTSADVTLNGDLGEYAIFEADTLGVGYVREVERKIWI